MYNLRLRPVRPDGFYKLLNSGKFASSPRDRTNRRRIHRNVPHRDAFEAHLLSCVRYQVVEGLKFKARPPLVHRARIQIAKAQHRILEAFGFDRKWRPAQNWLTQKELPTKRSDIRGNVTQLLPDTFRIRIVAKAPIRFYDEHVNECFTDEIYFFHLKFQTDF